jgi:hypothetical protein
MELHCSRDEILRQVRAMLGIQTDNSLASQVAEQHVVAVNAAATKAAQECKWVNAQGRVTVDLQAEQDTIDYPEGQGPGSVQAIAIYESERYYPVDPRIIPIHADADQQQLAGGETFKAVQGRPRYFEQRSQIKLFPFTDKPYKARIDYMRPIQMPTGSTVSIIDAQLIIYGAASMLAKIMSDGEMATYYAGLYTDRLHALMAWQSQGSTFAMQTEADLAEDEALVQDLVPKWDRRPTIGPGA